MKHMGCSNGNCVIMPPVGMHTNSHCNCPVVGDRNKGVSQDDRMKLREAFQELNKEIKRLRAEALVKDSNHKQKVTRMETALYNILANSKSQPQSDTDKVNVEIAVRGLSEPAGLEALFGALKDE